MEAFILALLGRRINSMYLLAIRAGLSPGSIRLVIQRLERNRLIRRDLKGKRNKRVMEATGRGRRVLAAAFTGMTEDTLSWDLESSLRALWSALQVSKEIGLRLLDRIASQRKERAADLELIATRLSPGTNDPIVDYRFMRAFCKALQLRAEAKAIEEIGARIEPTRLQPEVNATEPYSPQTLANDEPRQVRPPLKTGLGG